MKKSIFKEIKPSIILFLNLLIFYEMLQLAKHPFKIAILPILKIGVDLNYDAKFNVDF